MTIRFILFNWAVPSEFIEMDDHVSAADSYVNTRDVKVALDNHNISLARRARQPIISQEFGAASDPRDPLIVQSIHPVSVNRNSGKVFYLSPIWIPPVCFEIQLSIRAGVADAGEFDAKIYPVIDGPGERNDVDTSLEITVNAAAEAKYTATIPVPQSAQWAREAMLYLYYETPLYDVAAKGGGTAITDVSRREEGAWVVGPFAGTWAGFFLVCTTDTTVLPIQIVEGINLGGGSYKLYLEGPWRGKVPIVGTDEFDIYQANYLKVWNVSAYPVAVTNWSAERV